MSDSSLEEEEEKEFVHNDESLTKSKREGVKWTAGSSTT